MKTVKEDNYIIPSKLTDFQRKMYIHLINWKCKNQDISSTSLDAWLPKWQKDDLFPLYTPIKEIFKEHQKNFHFKSHRFLGRHMASSQVACANLFLPILKDPKIAAKILSIVKTDMKKIAVNMLGNGYQIEFWDETTNYLSDHSKISGTDSDIAIAYYDYEDNLNLWLIEHKLTEREFTNCGGFKSKNNKKKFNCLKPASGIINNPNLCYYHRKCNFNYWNITLDSKSPINLDALSQEEECPFKGGLSQLWRNLLLGFCIESSNSTRWPYKKVYFSVVYHPNNTSLHSSISEFQKLLKFPDRFMAFPSDELINSANVIKEKAISEWVCWYKKLYYY